MTVGIILYGDEVTRLKVVAEESGWMRMEASFLGLETALWVQTLGSKRYVFLSTVNKMAKGDYRISELEKCR